ncbi:MAG: 50S ribosomal protein L25 [Spirochaetales bacterium]|nr:50S ribosomal protein L25 [Spirochaetales bacterium]
MEVKKLKASVRTEKKKNSAKKLRRQGRIPAVIYGHGGNSVISVDEHEFMTKFQKVSENTIINIQTEDHDKDVLVKDYQEDITTGKILHIDFFEIERGKTLKTRVPVDFVGTAPGVKVGGIFETLMHEVEIECLPKDLPEKLEVDISSLEIGDAIHIEDIALGDAIKILNAGDQVICTISAPRVEEEVVEEEEEEEEVEEEEAETSEEE